MRVKTEEKRKCILEAAKAVFLERGFLGASMAEVSARAGGSKQTLYSYFASKDDLFVATMLEKGTQIIDPVFATFDTEEELRPALNRFGRAFLPFIASDEVLAFRRMIIAEGARSNLGQLFFENGPKRGWTRMTARFEYFMAAGKMRRVDPWRAAMHFQALCESGPFYRLLEGVLKELTPELIDETVDAAVDVFMRAYGVESEAA
ncbi:TetR/AcrR family transcriptional regulator [Caulobacter hibisci]|uniref:TetR/AcrR family transcriptional regulator n=1 Tax=Caulobacter hibisci TaxID=2035993 RepID=A0ABS0T4C3_9CAUL|nr:TetR/AcrR family transcriptional regulator [Caulobacter hibisci]